MKFAAKFPDFSCWIIFRILTTNNRECQHLQKFIQLNEIEFRTGQNAKDSGNFTKYLTLLCLSLGCELPTHVIERLIASNNNDMRKTLNEIEFFVRGENPKSSIKDLLVTVSHPSSTNINSSRKIFDEVSLKSSLALPSAAISTNEYKDFSYQQQELSKEIDSYLSARCSLSSDEKSFADHKNKVTNG